jgi:hypothetical protein
VQIAKYEITISVCILEGHDTRASGIRGNYPLLLKYKNLWISAPGYAAEMFVAAADRGHLSGLYLLSVRCSCVHCDLTF